MTITVLGCGVIGLTTALKLQEEGHRVQVKTWKMPPDTTSDKAAAFWSPYRIAEDERTHAWITETYAVLEGLSQVRGSGVSMVPLRKYLRDGADQSDLWWLRSVPGGRYIALGPREVPPGFASGWALEVPLMETPLYLPYLMRRLALPVQSGHKVTDLASEEGIVINCTGLGSRTLCADSSLVPVRGQIAVTKAQPTGAIYVDADTPTYVVPRADGCIIGGTYERDQWEEVPDPATIQALLAKAPTVAPGLDPGPALRSYAGLRPARPTVRLEVDAARPGLIHHYGHGGAGFTLSWGAASAVAALVRGMR